MQYKFKEPLQGTIGKEPYRCTITWRNGQIISDEPASSGGGDTGPDPHSLLLSSLAACTLITLRMYIDRKGWDIPEMSVHTNLFETIKDGKQITTIDRDIRFFGEVDTEKKLRLKEIASHCPISKIMENEVKVRTFVFRDEDTRNIHYSNNDISVVWKPDLCQHSGRCWSQLPEVFDYKKKKWISPEGAPSNRIIEQVKKCPSGALSVESAKGGEESKIETDMQRTIE
jgi:putative redox protein